VTVTAERAERARAVMIQLFPEGFEESTDDRDVELAAYTDAGGEERLRRVFEGATTTEIPEDWEERWRQFHRPVRVGRLWVGPPWEEPPPDVLAVVIDPGRAFGTGAHPTTMLCLAHLLELEPTSLLDVGCGSGVLSIAAARLGFAPVRALDVDPAAVAIAQDNATANEVEIDARLGNAADGDLPPAGVAVLNIALEPVVEIGPRCGADRLVTSGYLELHEPVLSGYRHEARKASAGWAADLYARAE
jgi:ribosomal protein L11 methyltransferase